jgi:hypothetical protein
MAAGVMFNIDSGYLEGLCRGFKCGILKQSDYLNLVQCETLEGRNEKKSIKSFCIPIFGIYSQSITCIITTSCLSSSSKHW